MNAKQLIAPAAALLAAAAVLLAACAALSGAARRSGEAARNEIMSYMLPSRPASFTEEAYDGEDESIRRVFKAEDGYVLDAPSFPAPNRRGTRYWSSSHAAAFINRIA